MGKLQRIERLPLKFADLARLVHEHRCGPGDLHADTEEP